MHDVYRRLAERGQTSLREALRSGFFGFVARGRRKSLSLVACAAAILGALFAAGCSVHTGGSEVAYLRNGQLWVVQSDGTDPRMLASGGIVSFAWSPDHHSLAYRTVKSGTESGADAVGGIFAISVNGGYPLQITPDDAGVALGDPSWDADGNRVLYREANLGSLNAPLFIVSQTDQPLGLARKVVANAVSVPALSADGQQVAVIDAAGNVLVGSPGGAASVVGTGALTTLPGTGRVGRVLWQPQHDAVLYAEAASDGVKLELHANGGATRTIASVNALLDASFSPDGTLLLVRTPTEFALWNTKGDASPLFTWAESDAYALPWWSPNGRMLVVEDSGGVVRVDVQTHKVDTLLSEAEIAPPTEQPLGWRVAVGSPFSPDGTALVFSSEGGATWHGGKLSGSGHLHGNSQRQLGWRSYPYSRLGRVGAELGI